MQVIEFLAWAAGIIGVPVIAFYWLRGRRHRAQLRRAAEPAGLPLETERGPRQPGAGTATPRASVRDRGRPENRK